MSNKSARRAPDQKGYSLVEALVVVAIIGVISLVLVPNFASLYRGFRFKATLHQFTSDIRNARQTSVTKNVQVMLSVIPDTQTYQAQQSTDNGATWTDLWSRTVATTGFFESSTFPHNTDGPHSTSRDMVFYPDGSVDNQGSIVIRTTDDIPKNQYTVDITTAGRIKSTSSHF